MLFFGALFVLPFYWFTPDELDMGGDSARLWLYSPMDYVRSTAFYSIDPQGTAKITANQYLIPHILMLEGIRKVFGSSFILVGLEKGMKLSLSFLFIYLFVRDVLREVSNKKKENARIIMAALGAGVWYALSGSVTGNMPYALLTHNQVFLNPAMMYLLLSFLKSGNMIFAWIAIGVSVIFSPNFSLVAPPQLFAFYPLAFLFVFLAFRLIFKRTIPWKRMLAPLFFFLLLHAFHLLPEIQYLANPGSELFGRAFGKESNSVSYFNAILGLGKVSAALLQGKDLIPLLVIIVGLRVAKHRRLMVLTSVFFLITLTLLSANITQTVVWLYRKLFLIPGFGMFRNFIGQWQFVYTFFYALMLGFGLHAVFTRLKYRTVILMGALYFALIIFQSWQFLRGSVAQIRHQGADVRTAITMDPAYENMLDVIKNLPQDGKILTLPFTDFYFQVLGGANGGAYIGPSSISYLTGRNDFAGYQIMNPFPEQFMEYARTKDYKSINKLFGLLNIRYIFHNSDPNIYDTRFPGSPYSYMRTKLPETQLEYSDFVDKLGAKRIYEVGPYRLFENPSYTTLFSLASSVYLYDGKEGDWHGLDIDLLADANVSLGAIFIERNICKVASLPISCDGKVVSLVNHTDVAYKKIDPTHYRIIVSETAKPVFLIFANAFNASWVLQKAGSSDAVAPHFPVNGYANAWVVEGGEYEVKMIGQWYADMGLRVSIVGTVLFFIWGMYLVKRAWYNNQNDL